MPENKLTWLDRAMTSPSDALKKLASQTYSKTLGREGAGGAIGDAVYNYLDAGTGQLGGMFLEAESRADKKQQKVADAFGERASGANTADIFASLLAQETGKGDSFMDQYRSTFFDTMNQGGEIGSQAVDAMTDPEHTGNDGFGAFDTARATLGEMFVPQDSLSLGTALATAPLAVSSGAGPTVKAMSSGTKNLAKRGNNVLRNRAARSADVSGQPIQGPRFPAANSATQKKALSDRGVDVSKLTDQQVTQLYREFASGPKPKTPTAAQSKADKAYEQARAQLEGRAQQSTRSPNSSKVNKPEKSSANTAKPEAVKEPARFTKEPIRYIKEHPIRTGVTASTVGVPLAMALTGSANEGGSVTPDQKKAFLSEAASQDAASTGGSQNRQVPPQAPISNPTQGGSFFDRYIQFIEKQKAEQEPNTLQKIGNTLTSTGVALNGGDPRAQHRASELPNRTPDEQALAQIVPQLAAFEMMSQAQQQQPMSAMEQMELEQMRAKILESQAMSQYMQRIMGGGLGE